MGREECEYRVGDGLFGEGVELATGFDLLPDQAKALFFSAVEDAHCDLPMIHWVNGITCDGCQSPIEHVLYMALGIAFAYRNGEMITLNNNGGGVCCSCVDFTVLPQYEISVDDKTYYADFVIAVDYSGDEIDGYVQGENIVIECDGYEYHHADKSQVAHDYDRENAIKKAGYTVLRFTGSQIYNDPMKCADDVIDYLIAGMNRRHEEYLEGQEDEKQLCNVC